MEEPISQVLTKEVGPDGLNPLFKNPHRLAKVLSDLPDNPYEDRKKNLYGFLMQVFRDERACPQKLQTLILRAVESRLGELNIAPNIKTYWLEKVTEAFEKHNSRKDEPKPFEVDRIFNEMLADAENARAHFVITFRTIEERGEKSKTKSFREVLIRNLHLYDSAPAVPPEVYYTFCLPSDAGAKAFWKGLFETITKKNPAGDNLEGKVAETKLQELSDKEFLRVWIVPPCMCGVPMVIFNPDDGSESSAYSFCFHPHDRVSIMKFDEDSIANWKNLVYRPFKYQLIKHFYKNHHILDWKQVSPPNSKV